MGQSQASNRLHIIKENVVEITEKIKTDKLTDEDRGRSHDILLDYIKELKFILSRSLRTSRIHKVERLIICALQELATLEGEMKSIEPRLKAKSLQKLNEIEKDVNFIKNKQNLDDGIDAVDKYKRRISLIEDVDPEVEVKRNKVLHVVTSTLHELESEEKLRQVQLKHDQGRLDLTRFMGVSESNCYRRHKEHLLTLRDEINRIPNANTKVTDGKKYLLFNIDNNLAALDKKVNENEEVIKKQIVHEETTKNLSGNLLETVVRAYADFESCFSANCSPQELRDMFRKLGELRLKIDQKLNVLENQMEMQELDPLIELVPVKETSFPVKKVENFPLRRFSQIKEIEKGVQGLQEQIAKSNYSRDSQCYVTFVNKLEDYRKDLTEIPVTNDEEEDYTKTVFEFIEDASVFLERNAIGRRSTTGDVLIDIMSISTAVNELGDNLKQAHTTREYEAIRNELMENLYYLRKLEIPIGRSNICKFRDYVLIQTESHLSNLEKLKKSVHKSKLVEAKNEEMFSF